MYSCIARLKNTNIEARGRVHEFVDQVDLAILQEMTSGDAMLFGGLNPRVSPESMAHRVGLNPSTIRKRMKAWREIGFLRDWKIMPNPTALGLLHYTGYVIATNVRDRQNLRAAVELLDGAVVCFEHVGGMFGIGMYARNQQEAERRYEGIAKLSGVKMVGKVALVPHTESVPLKPRDWQFLAALRETPDATIPELAKATGVSATTAGNRLRKLIANQIIWTTPHLDFTRYHGGLIRIYLDVQGTTPRAVVDHLHETHPTVFYRDISTPSRPRAHAMLHIQSAAQMDDIEQAASQITGVTKVTMTIPREFQPVTYWIDEQVNARI